MSKRAEEAALKAYPIHPYKVIPVEGAHGEILNFDEWLDDFRISVQSFSLNAGFRQGYEQAEKDTVDRAAEWWYEHIVGFMSEGLVKNVIEEFREAMADEDTSTTK